MLYEYAVSVTSCGCQPCHRMSQGVIGIPRDVVVCQANRPQGIVAIVCVIVVTSGPFTESRGVSPTRHLGQRWSCVHNETQAAQFGNKLKLKTETSRAERVTEERVCRHAEGHVTGGASRTADHESGRPGSTRAASGDQHG